jgi:uncharacterized surface protein with fasciclin (FAS1) repeats
MKHISIHIKLWLVGCIAISLSACLKETDAPATPAISIPFEGTDLAGTLAKESSLQLFNRAFKRLSLESQVTNNTGYTIFAPTDSAMKAAGLDEAGIDQMNIDQLRNRITYQIAIGALDDRALSLPVTATYLNTLRTALKVSPDGSALIETAPLYVKEDDHFYFNGTAVTKRASVIKATNGYIYPVTAFAAEIPAATMLDAIQNDPDCSLYYQSMQLIDSINNSNYFSTELALLGRTTKAGMYPAVLVPTNKAFEEAGFHNIDELRDFALSAYIGFDEIDFFSIHYSPLDSMLRRHIIYNDRLSVSYYYTKASVRIFYNDLLNPDLNNDKLNTYIYGTGTVIDGTINYGVPLIFSAVNGVAQVKQATTTQSYPVSHDPSYVTSNGTIYKMDHLLYPLIIKK